MDNFRHFDKRSGRRKASLDGFVKRDPRQRSHDFDIFHRDRNPQEPSTPIGDFKRTEGFHAAEQPRIETKGATSSVGPDLRTNPLLVAGYQPERPRSNRKAKLKSIASSVSGYGSASKRPVYWQPSW